MRLHPSASKTFQSNPTLGQEYRHAVASNARGIGPFQSNPTLGQEYRCKPRVGLRPHKSFNPTRPSARNIAPLPGSRCFWPLVSIQPDPRPGISRYPVLLLTSTSNPFQSNPTLGQEYRPAARATCPYPCPCFNPTRPSARNIAALAEPAAARMASFNPTRPSARNIAQTFGPYDSPAKLFQSNPTLGQEYRAVVTTLIIVQPGFNPTRPSARNIAPPP